MRGLGQIQKTDSTYELLPAGRPCRERIIEDIRAASSYVLLINFLARKDASTDGIAEALLDNGNAQSLWIKDRIAAFYEYSEQDGQSFFHDNPRQDHMWWTPHRLQTVYWQARFMDRFYRNGAEKNVKKNPLREQLVDAPNITVIDDNKLYDHSKLIVVDGKLCYIGDMGFGDDFLGDNPKYLSYMLRIEDKDHTKDLLRTVTGLKKPGEPSGFINGREVHRQALEFIHKTRERIIVESSYLGNRAYIKALREILFRRVKVLLLLPEEANVHQHRNRHFVKTLRRMSGAPDNLEVHTTPLSHSKMMVRDNKEAWIGSHNLSMINGTVNDTVFLSSDIKVVDQVKAALLHHKRLGKKDLCSENWKEILAPSLLEQASVKWQFVARSSRLLSVGYARKKCRRKILELVGPL